MENNTPNPQDPTQFPVENLSGGTPAPEPMPTPEQMPAPIAEKLNTQADQSLDTVINRVPDTTSGPQPNSNKIYLVIAVVVAVLLVGAASAYYFLFMNNEAADETMTEESPLLDQNTLTEDLGNFNELENVVDDIQNQLEPSDQVLEEPVFEDTAVEGETTVESNNKLKPTGDTTDTTSNDKIPR